ncbi:symmetrical bis(5'-nucleosyl)-tetraphosphatase [Ferrimonas senticii]|uniref:symmetrical bis(5'-nucleosyl)-tetraphosphatase n=1 Tax=Ferrimonas senticii TaxID=394566 RepID=UPI00040BBE28|nr:symmetrical bis(5'-nucleosyl)-tetraphosphatase [Ferrimonas senticii]
MSNSVQNLFVGDIQGCLLELQQLLSHLNFEPTRDYLWVCGDLISRGPDSLATLRYLKSLGEHAKVVLGNHDLHLFCVAAGLKKGSRRDRQEALLAATDLPELIHWLRQQPLLRECSQHNVVMTHAGLPPQWDLAIARSRAAEAAAILRGDDYLDFCQQMYGDKPDSDDPHAPLYERATFTVNAFTRMRYLRPDGSLEFEDKTSPQMAEPTSSDNIPWFTYPNHQTLPQHRLVFGHWAALLGQTNHANALGLDMGCCWGGHLCIWHAEHNAKYLIPAGGGTVEQQQL